MKIISGGQTGVDRGALDAALDLGVEVGGWCPHGRRAEDGKIPEKYAFLVETPQPAYLQRTEWNARDADATLILHAGEMGPGTKATIRLCTRRHKAHLVVDMRDKRLVRETVDFLAANMVNVLNVAGPRESGNEGIGELARGFVTAIIQETRP